MSTPPEIPEETQSGTLEERKSIGVRRRGRMVLGAEVFSRIYHEIGHITPNGLSNLHILEEGQTAVIAVTHRTELDIPIAVGVVGKEIPVVTTGVSSEMFTLGNLRLLTGAQLAGQENYIPISYRWGKGNRHDREAGPLNIDDFAPMIDALHSGKNVIIATHNPKKRDGSEPEAGYGAALLSALSGAPIIPVSVKLTPHRFLRFRKDVDVTIGRPFELDDSLDAELLKSVLKKRKVERLNKQEIDDLKAQFSALRESGETVYNRTENL